MLVESKFEARPAGRPARNSSRRVMPLLGLGLMLFASGCAEQTTYAAPPGRSSSTLEKDRAACHDESQIQRLQEDRVTLEQQCMMSLGYIVQHGS